MESYTMSLYDWILLLSIIFSQFAHIVACITITFLFIVR